MHLLYALIRFLAVKVLLDGAYALGTGTLFGFYAWTRRYYCRYLRPHATPFIKASEPELCSGSVSNVANGSRPWLIC